MADTKDYLQVYRRFFEEFAATVNPDDQLPVKVGGYYLCDSEIVGEIVDWTLQYLNQKRCPSSLVAPLTRIVIEEIKLACKKQPIACGYRSAENTYQPLKLMQVVTGKVNEVCLRYRDNGKLATLPPPAPGPPISSCAIKNTRRRMEDRHVVIEDFHAVFDIQDPNPTSYYAVFDGHAGTDAAVYSVSHLHQFLAESSFYPTDPERALKDAFSRTDALFLEKSNRENLRSGTTAVCALLRLKEKMLYVAWLGDSQALLVRKGQAVQVVNPHKPDRQDERQRIEDMGGCVLYWGTWRVNGQLAVSRAIGDLDYKPYVTAEPDVTAVSLNGAEDFLVLACDGLWDFVTEQEAVEAVYQQVHAAPGDLEAVSQRLVQLSKQQGSTDNISVIVVFLTDPAQLASRSVPLPLDVPRSQWASLSNGPQQEASLPSSAPKSHNMETSFDHNTNDTSASNNPFLMNPTSNGPDSVPYQKGGLLLDLGGGGDAELTYKQNGTSPSKTDLYFLDRPANGKNTEGVDNNYDDDDDDDDDFGPETDVDAVDDVLLSPAIAATKAAALLSPSNNNPFGVSEFEDKKEKEEHMTAMEADLELQRQQTSDFDLIKEPREETPTPPADEVPGLTTGVPESDNVAESGEDSEDEWNYFRVEPTAADPEKNQQTTQEVCKNPAQLQLEDESNMESQLNPDAAEFVPSPTQMTPSVDEVLLAESPKKGIPMEDISIPSQIEFQHEASQRPSELDLANEPSSLPQQKLPDLINCEEGGDIGNPFLPPGAICGKSIHHLNNEGSFSKLLEQGDSNFQEQNGVFVDQQCSNIRETVGHIFDESEVSSTKVEFGDDSTSFLVSGSDLQNTIENISFSALEENVSFSTLEESLVDQDLLPTEHVTDVTKSDNASPFNELSEFVSETCMNNSVGRENVQHEEANNLVETSIERMPMSFELCKELIPEMECKPERVLLESEGTSSFEQDDSGSPVQAEDTKLEDIGEQPVISPLHSAVPVHEDIPVEPEIEDDIAVPLAADLHCTLLGKESPVCESESLTDDQPASPLQSPKPFSPLQAPTPEVHIPSLWGTTSPVPCLADTASTPETLPLLQDIQSPSPVLEMKSPVCENPPSIEDVESPVRGFESPLLEQESSQLLADDSVCKDKPLEGSELLECITQEATHENIEVDKTNSLDPMNLCMYSAADNAELQPLSKIDESTEMLTCEKLVEDMSVLTTEQKELIPILPDETNSTVPHVEDIIMPPIPAQMSEETPEIVPISQESLQLHETIPVTSEGELSAAPAIVAASAMVVAVAAAGVGISSEEKSAVETKSPEKISTETKKQDKKGQVADKTKTTKMPSTAKSAAGTSAAKTLQKSTPTSPTKPVTASVRSSTPRKPSTPVSTTTTKVTKSPATPTSKPKMGVTSPTKPISTSTKSPAASSPRARPASAATTTTTTTVAKSATLANGDLANKSAAVKKTTTKSTRPVTAPATTKTATTKTSTATSKTTALSAAPPRPKPGAVNGVASKPRTTTTVTTASARSKVGSTRDTKLVTDKQIKETANKQISSTRTITAKSTTTTGVRSTATTASRKVTGVTKTTTATATTTIKSSTGKVGTKKSTITTTSATRTASTSPPKITKTAVTAENNELV